MPDRFYITTPIYYPNGEPHVGHYYTTLCADILARYHRLLGKDVFFLTGTDEHGIKMVKTAADLKTTPEALANANAQVFIDAFADFGITHSDFIRTTQPRHKLAVQEIVRRLQANGDIYLGSYEGWYDEGQEEFITETEAKDAEYKSRISGKPFVRYSEPTYFFRLTQYVEPVYKAIESDQIRITPASRKNEILSKLKGWDQDLSISRASLTWGIQMPDDPAHVLYVWIDALSNYITALGWPDGDRYKTYWPADLHLIGKEILWFHAFYWPAMLLSLGVPLPKQLFAHGWWVVEGKKMSKSMGNFVDLAKLRELHAKYGLDSVRYYLVRAGPFGGDLDFLQVELDRAYGELGNIVGNLLNRLINMTRKYRDGVVPEIGTTDDAVDGPLVAKTASLAADLAGAYERIELQQCALIPVELARAANAYVDATAPFKLAKDPAQAKRLDTVLARMIHATQATLVALLPILPEKASAGLKQLGLDPAGKSLAELLVPLPAGHKLGEPSVLFPRFEEKPA